MSDISASLRAEVVLRTGNRCEYCGLSQLGQEAAFHIDHVIPRAAGGQTEAGNLALACVSCSLRKRAHQTAPDPDTGEEVPLFTPGRTVGRNTSDGTANGWYRSHRQVGQRWGHWRSTGR
jgi:hypothetical protein